MEPRTTGMLYEAGSGMVENLRSTSKSLNKLY